MQQAFLGGCRRGGRARREAGALYGGRPGIAVQPTLFAVASAALYLLFVATAGRGRRWPAWPAAYSLSRSHESFAPPPNDRDAVLYVGPGALRGHFDASREAVDIGDDMRAYLLTGQRRSWEPIWPHERTLTVS